MAARKPNNLPWIILGGVCGAVLLGLFGFGVYKGAQSVRDEMAITMPDGPKPVTSSDAKNTQAITVFVDSMNEISLDGVVIEDVAALKKILESLGDDSLKSTVFILRLSEKSSHARLIAIKDMFDDFEVRSIIEIVRADAE